MTDRELLELAAKTAGIHGCWVADGINTGSNPSPVIWNPLDDDGDALRLAVKLEINPKWLEGKALAWAVGKSAICRAEALGKDPYAATRRAIVRAAAEIGRQMP